jgi:hypothetical protein
MIGLITILSLALVGMAITRNCIFERTSIAGVGGVATGTLEAYGNRIWISQGLRDAEEGDSVSWRSDLVVEVTKTLATDVVADEADVRVDLATGLMVAAGGTIVGSARGGTANGDLTVLIALNQQA